jgi:hypothetical protein
MDLVSVRKKAEEAVADMAEGPLKTKAFEVILQTLLAGPALRSEVTPRFATPEGNLGEAASSLTDRIRVLATVGFLAQPRSLGEIQAALAERGWHYAQENLSTPLVRLVRQRQLRRLQQAEGKKRVWKYSLP